MKQGWIDLPADNLMHTGHPASIFSFPFRLLQPALFLHSHHGNIFNLCLLIKISSFLYKKWIEIFNGASWLIPEAAERQAWWGQVGEPPSRVERAGLVKGARLPSREPIIGASFFKLRGREIDLYLGPPPWEGPKGKGGIFARISEISWQEDFEQFPAGI